MFITLKLLKAIEFDKSLITTRRITTTTTKSILRPLPQYLLAVKKPTQSSLHELQGEKIKKAFA